MSSDIEIVIKSETGAIEEELELELDEGHTIKDILDYLVQMNLLKVPHNDVTLYKDGKIVSPNLELEDRQEWVRPQTIPTNTLSR
jgi:hypothetical protein